LKDRLPFFRGISVQNTHVCQAYKWLLVRVVTAALIGYITTILVASLAHPGPAALLKMMRFGLPHFGMMITSQGGALGINAWLTYFICNLFVAFLIVVLVYWAKLLNPYDKNTSLSRLRRHLQKDPSSRYLLRIKYFSRIQSPQLRLASFVLLAIPYIATITVGLMAGALIGVGLVFSSSPLLALAYFLPHGIPEFAAILLACSLPIGTWMSMGPVAGNVSAPKAFQVVDRVLASQQFQQHLKMIVNLLVIAALTEAHLTHVVVSILSGN
jgi:uncharacterized membrane protein SpoIIM required for sporulation